SAAERTFECAHKEIVGRSFTCFLTAEACKKLAGLVRGLQTRPRDQQRLWIPGGLNALDSNGNMFSAEATLSASELNRKSFYTLILRNVNERLKAEQKINQLTEQAEYLKEEIKQIHNFDEIIGQSEAIRRVLRDVERVASADTTVLLLGETGTGKELIARAIHSTGKRRDKPLIKVNCAAIPATLIESEFFGHERGAFTGATVKRRGRFSLADGGTIFLDEVGELATDLQAKLLRVLQEGEFEPVGGSQTVKVDVRVIAATNRDLQQAVRNRTFREDLYYRLNVFPITLPPLRSRDDDTILLANSFIKKFAQKIGRPVAPLSQGDIRSLKSYNWPGNVRELENVIERAVITSEDGQLNLHRALPETAKQSEPRAAAVSGEANRPVLTARELSDLERQNIIAALESCDWRVAGEHGAAKLLGLRPSTLSSRMKALGINRP
ncbi:MAG TPA: sigma 54-interacting transcriptional regulator, partial [Blastocatellia bacterium]|nr:sigma 54-interacting transcriptional regulator [Blastocatellia bacterium]